MEDVSTTFVDGIVRPMDRMATLIIDGGPLNGKSFGAIVPRWPPPKRLIGSDIHATLLGTYELVEATDGSRSYVARYRLRQDGDFHRIVRNAMRKPFRCPE